MILPPSAETKNQQSVFMRIRDIVIGLVLITLGIVWLYQASYYNTIAPMELRRQFQFVEMNITESARSDSKNLNRDIWERALIITGGDMKLRGARSGESFSDLLKRINQSIQMRYFPGWSLLLIGIVMCIPSGVWTANTVEQGAAANP